MLKVKSLPSSILLLITPLVILGVITWLAVMYSHQIQLFQMGDVQIFGCDFIKEVEVQSILSEIGPETLTGISINDLENRLEKEDYIMAAKVSRIFPSILIIEIMENEPVAYVSCSDGLVALGCNSEFLPVDKSVENHYDLPLIVGITDSLTTDSLHSDGEAILQEVLELTQLMRSDYESLYTWTASIEIEKSEVTFKNHNKRSTKVLCSRESIQNQLEVLKAFEETVADSRKLDDYYYINLTLPNYVIVKEKNI